MQAIAFLSLILISAVPSHDAITAAKSKVEDLFGDELAAAKKPKEKIALAGEMLKTAATMSPKEPDQAARYVLAKTARKLAIEAGDKKTALDAVTMLVEQFADTKDINPSEELKNGDYVWKQAKQATAGTRLEFQIQAAECYLKVKKAGTGLDKRLAEKRLGEVYIGDYIIGKDRQQIVITSATWGYKKQETDVTDIVAQALAENHSVVVGLNLGADPAFG
jgi:hypothetical protein